MLASVEQLEHLVCRLKCDILHLSNTYSHETMDNIALVDTAAGGRETQPYLYVLTYFAEQTSDVTFSSMGSKIIA